MISYISTSHRTKRKMIEYKHGCDKMRKTRKRVDENFRQEILFLQDLHNRLEKDAPKPDHLYWTTIIPNSDCSFIPDYLSVYRSGRFIIGALFELDEEYWNSRHEVIFNIYLL